LGFEDQLHNSNTRGGDKHSREGGGCVSKKGNAG